MMKVIIKKIKHIKIKENIIKIIDIEKVNIIKIK